MLSRTVRVASGVHFVRPFSAQSLKPSFFDRLLNDAPSQNPLNEEFPGLPSTRSSVPTSTSTTSVLPNGVRVVSIDNGGSVANVSVFALAGSRYESVPGTAHVLEHLAFASTQRRSAAKIQHDVDAVGATVASSAGREVFSLTGEALREDAPELLGLFGESLTQPRLKPWEVDEGKHTLAELIESQAAHPRIAVLEAVHAAAYGPASALGHGLFATPAGLGAVDGPALRGLLDARVNAKHVVVAAVNVDHAALVSALGRDGGVATLAEGAPTERATGSTPAFIGGEHLVRTAAGGAAHIALAFAAPSLSSKSIHALGVWQALLGGTPEHGGAAGQLRLGPQRQTRIARSVHTEAHSFIRSLTAFALPYSDTGVLGFVGSAADHESARLVHAIAGFLKDSAGQPITPVELARAKKQYKLALLAQTESRAGAAADAAHQLLLTGSWQAQAAALAAIDAVTVADVQSVAAAALKSAPAIAAFGSLEQVPRYDVLTGLFK